MLTALSILGLAAGDGALSIWAPFDVPFDAVTDRALALLLTLLERPLARLLSGLVSDPSTLGTLRIVAVRAKACFETEAARLGMLLTVPAEAGVKVLVPGESSSEGE